MKSLKKIAVGALLAFSIGAGSAYATTGNNFTMLSGVGGDVGGTNDVVFTWNGTYNTDADNAVVNGTIASGEPFFGASWVAHDVQIFGPGNHTIEACLADESTNCVFPTPTTMNVGLTQVGVHMLFDWGAPSVITACGVVNCNIDVSIVWDMGAQFGPANMWLGGGGAGDANQVWDAMSGLAGGAFNGIPMVDGGFVGFHANFNVMGINVDTTDPVVILGGDNPMNVDLGGTYSDPSATATDGQCLPAAITPVVGGDTVDPNTIGAYNVTYTATDCYGNTDVETRVVNVVGEGPAITLAGDAEMGILVGTSFTDPGFSCKDEFDVEYNVTVGGDTVDVNTLKENPGYIITYDCTDGIQDADQKTREINIISNNPPVIAVNDPDPATAECGGTYTDAGAPCTDVEDNPDPVTSIDDSLVDTNNPGSYLVNFTCTDLDKASDTDSRTVNVVDTTNPTISLEGNAVVEVKKDDPYNDAGVNCTDTCDSSPVVDTTGLPIDTSIEGTYTVTYTCSDGSNNSATQITRTVEVGGCELEGSGANNRNNFTMFASDGGNVGGSNRVDFQWDGTFNVWVLPDPLPEGTTEADFHVMNPATDGNYVTNPVSNATIETDCPFFGYPWFAEPVYMYGPGTYTFETCKDDGSSHCVFPAPLTMTVEEGKIGSHMLFTWSVSKNIDMINIFNLNVKNTGQTLFASCDGVDQNQVWDLTSSDIDGDNITGAPFIDGPFVGFEGNMYLMRPGSPFVLPPGPPFIEISGDNPLVLAEDATFTCPDAVAVDLKDGELCDKITVVGCDSVDTDIPGGYTVTYEVIDSNGNTATDDLVVLVIGEPPPPGPGSNVPTVVPGATANHPTIVLNEAPSQNPHPLTYVCDDGFGCSGNEPGDVITATVVNYLVGTDEDKDTICDDYEDPGVVGYDLQDGVLTADDVVTTGFEEVSLCAPGTYTIIYTVTDSGDNPGVQAAAEGGLSTTAVRIVQVNGPANFDRGDGYVPVEPDGDPELLGFIGCSVGDQPVSPMNRADLLLVGCFLAILGIGRMRRNNA